QVFNYIYVKYFPVLIRYGHQFSKDHELVKDVIQDLFIYLKVKRKQLGSTSSIKFYLYKAYRRRISRYLKKYRWNVPPQDIADEGFEITLSQESKMIDSAINDEVKKRLEH